MLRVRKGSILQLTQEYSKDRVIRSLQTLKMEQGHTVLRKECPWDGGDAVAYSSQISAGHL